ncbi:ImmA/IrrE family metallo-endopeptidase [Pseudomonas luteola]
MAKKALAIAWDGNLPVIPGNIATKIIATEMSPDAVCTRRTVIVRPMRLYHDNPVSSRGFYDKEKNIFVCEYNPGEHPVRQRYASAHVLGQVVLSNPLNRVYENRSYPADTSDPLEQQARQFALELLMPKRMVRELFPVARSIEQFSEAFGVPTIAMRYRLKDLGLI